MAKRTSSEFSGYSLAKSNSKKGVNKHSDDVVGKDGETSPFARGDERDINSQPYVPPIAKSLGNRLVPGADCSAYPNMGILLSMQDKNNSAIINLYLRSNISEREASSQEYTPLHLACDKGDLSWVKNLVSYYKNIDIKNTSGNTPLHLACKFGHVPVIKFLIENGANINAINIHGETPLYLMAVNNSLDPNQKLSLLSTNLLQINVPDLKGNSLLHNLVLDGKYDEVIMLLDNNLVFDPNIKNQDGNNLFHIIANQVKEGKRYDNNKLSEIARKMTKNYTYDLNDINNAGETPHDILQKTKLEILLVDQGNYDNFLIDLSSSNGASKSARKDAQQECLGEEVNADSFEGE